MIVADTSIWIDHIRATNLTLSQLLDAEELLGHPYVLGEVAMGSLNKRSAHLNLLRNLPACELVANDDVLAFVEGERLFGLGIGLVDAHLLASVHRTPGAVLWTRDRRLHRAATNLALAYEPA